MDPFDYAAEDALLDAWDRAVAALRAGRRHAADPLITDRYSPRYEQMRAARRARREQTATDARQEREMDTHETDEDIVLIREAVAAVCRQFDDDYWSACDQEHRFPTEFYDAMAAGGWIGIAIPERVRRRRPGHPRGGDRARGGGRVGRVHERRVGACTCRSSACTRSSCTAPRR